VQQVLINLILNAIQAMERGTLTLRTFAEEGGSVGLSEDTGDGISHPISRRFSILSSPRNQRARVWAFSSA
jgi:signal transduction histidine kinase